MTSIFSSHAPNLLPTVPHAFGAVRRAKQRNSFIASRHLDDLAAGFPDHDRVTDLPVDQRLR